LFPTHEEPRRPGLLHVGYILILSATGGALVAYTTSRPWPDRTPVPLGARFFDTEEAARLNQPRAFMTRLDVLAKLPLSAAWFPDIEQGGQGVIAVAPARLREELTDLAAHLLRRHRALIEMRGM
jgi:hypothetical protein